MYDNASPLNKGIYDKAVAYLKTIPKDSWVKGEEEVDTYYCINNEKVVSITSTGYFSVGVDTITLPVALIEDVIAPIRKREEGHRIVKEVIAGFLNLKTRKST